MLENHWHGSPAVLPVQAAKRPFTAPERQFMLQNDHSWNMVTGVN
jgi:hypothetical protein